MTLFEVLNDPALEEEDLLSADVRFRSPFADYAGSDDVGHLVGLIRQVLVDAEPTLQLAEGAQTVTVFEARVADVDVQGVLQEERDPSGRLADAMLTLRPYAGLRKAMGAMQLLLEAAPLPSRADG